MNAMVECQALHLKMPRLDAYRIPMRHALVEVRERLYGTTLRQD